MSRIARASPAATSGRRETRHGLAAHLYPRRVAFRATLPRTTTGKIMRGVLRAEPAGKE
jgi:acyl-coenzyme A synthetase/AMP-(fatty) acid ligase